MPVRWSEAEIQAAVNGYFRLLAAELRGERLVKAREYERVAEEMGKTRSPDSVGYKFSNISTVMVELGLVHLSGHKPLRNIQSALRPAVEDYVHRHPAVLDLMDEFTSRDAVLGAVDLNWPLLRSDVPEVRFIAGRPSSFIPRQVDYVQRESQNRSLGLAGEIAVISYERAWLRESGRPDLSAAVEHVSRTQGDGAGYDILSFDPDGTKRYLEVKTTRRDKFSPFYVSSGEVGFSQRVPEQFELVRLFDFEKASNGFYVLHGDLNDTCCLDPTQFRAAPRISA